MSICSPESDGKCSSVSSTGIIKDSVLNHVVMTYRSYEEYLDSLITKHDVYYLEDIGVARQLVELGVINHLFSAIIPRSLFDARKKERGGVAAQLSNAPRIL